MSTGEHSIETQSDVIAIRAVWVRVCAPPGVVCSHTVFAHRHDRHIPPEKRCQSMTRNHCLPLAPSGLAPKVDVVARTVLVGVDGRRHLTDRDEKRKMDSGPEAPVDESTVVVLMRELAVCGWGTILEGTPRKSAGVIRRVARTTSSENSRGLEALFREHRRSLVAYAGQHAGAGLAEDVVQRAFEKVWRRGPVLAELDNPAAYLVTAVRNEMHRELRRTVTAREHIDPDPTGSLEHRPAPGDVSTQIGVRLMLRDELAKLSAREREAVVLRVQWQLSVSEAAQIMGVNEGTVKGYTFHGLRKLRDGLAAA